MSDPATDPAPSDPGRRIALRELAEVGSTSLLVLGLLSRLPATMLPLGIVLFVVDQRSSFVGAGVAVGALCLGQALGGPVLARLADRTGHTSVGLAATLLQTLGLAFFVVATAYDGPAGVGVALAALIGLSTPQIGALARSRWPELAARRPDRRAFVARAMGYEGVVDASSFLLGPALVGLVSASSPSGALFLTLMLAIVSQTCFALHGSAARGHPRRSDPTGRPDLRGLIPLVVVAVAVGLLLGSSEVGVVARMSATAGLGGAGPRYAAVGLGGVAVLLLLGRLHRLSLQARIIVGGLGIAGTSAALAQAGSPLTLCCFGLGVFGSLVLVSAYAVAGRADSDRRRATSMMAISTAVFAGSAVGAGAGAMLVAGSGAFVALLLGVGAGLVTSLAALALRRTT